MTRLYINSTDPKLAKRMKPEVYDIIRKRREALDRELDQILSTEDSITLEIGSGHGHFLTAYGENHPEHVCIGIDVNKGRVFKALKKAERSKLTNVFFLNVESMEFLNRLPSHIRLNDIWILYPDPWPKKRHFKNRIVQSRFLEKLASSTTRGGRLYIRSDYEPYIEWSRELIASTTQWRILADYDWPDLPTTVFQELTGNKYFSLAAELDPPEQAHEEELS